MPRGRKDIENFIEQGKATRFKSGNEAAVNGAKGGVESGQVRVQKATMATLARTIARAPAPEKAKKQLEAIGIDAEDANGNALVVAGVYNKAIHGDDKAVEKWESWTDGTAADEKPFKIPADIIGKAFVDINRHIEPNKTYIFKGGRGGLKSTYISEKLIELLKNNPTMHACVIRKVGGTLKDSVYAQIKWAIHALDLDAEFTCKGSQPPEIQYKKTGQKIYFRGLDDPMKLKSIKPEFGYIGILWIEERDQLNSPEEERSVKQSVLRGGAISYDFASYNPPKSRDNWVNEELLTPDDNRIVHTSTYLDAPAEWLGQKFLDDAEHLKEVNYDAYEHEYLGVANGAGGNVFDNIERRELSDKDIAFYDRIYQGVDWGWYPDPFAFIRLYYNPKTEEIIFVDEIRCNKTGNTETARLIQERGYDDAHIICDSAEHKSTADFRACGLPAQDAIKGPGSVEYSMKWLQARKLVFDPKRTPYAYEEFTKYKFEVNKDGKVTNGYPDKDNHFIDATRYALERVWNKYRSTA